MRIIAILKIMMMWFHCVYLLIGSCMALRTSEAPAPASAGVKKYAVHLALTLTEPKKKIGRSIEIAVDGARSLSKIHPTELGAPVVLHHLSQGSVVTAHVGTHGACAYLVAVTTGPTHFTVGEWELSFTSIEENDQGLISEAVYEAYVKIVGWGSLVTIDVDHNTVYTFDAIAPNETFLYAGLPRGALVRAVSNATGDTCTYRVGNTEVLCHLDTTWGLLLGSVMQFGENDDDEGVSHIEDVKHYTVEFALERDTAAAKQLDIGLNGHEIASKMKATEPGKSIIIHHVKGGSVFTAVGLDIGQACSIYVGALTGLQTATCAGWTLNVNIKEETGGSFEDREEIYDLSFSVHRVSNETSGEWGLIVNDDQNLFKSPNPRMFPGTLSGYKKKDRVRPYVDDVIDTQCVHVTGVDEITSCEYNGWKFTIMSTLNMNHPWDGNNWDYDWDSDDDTDDSKPFEITVTAIDKSSSSLPSTLECIARRDLDFDIVPLGETSKHITNGTQLFKTKNLTTTAETEDLVTVKTATFVGQFPSGYYLAEGFYCTLYQEETVKCEADTEGGAWTWDKQFSLEIELNE